MEIKEAALIQSRAGGHTVDRRGDAPACDVKSGGGLHPREYRNADVKGEN